MALLRSASHRCSRVQAVGNPAFRWGLAPLTVVIVLATMLTIGVLAAPAFEHWPTRCSETDCGCLRQQIQEHADRYFLDQQRWPDRNLQQLTHSDYWGGPVDVCPTSGVRYQMSGSVVACPVHEKDRIR